MAEQFHCWTERWCAFFFWEWLQWSPRPQLLDVVLCSVAQCSFGCSCSGSYSLVVVVAVVAVVVVVVIVVVVVLPIPMVSKQHPKISSGPAPSSQKPLQHNSGKGNRKGQNRFRPYGSKGKGKGKKFEQRIPREIREAGGAASTPDGDPISFDFSLKRCKENVSDGRCRKGYNLCCICYGFHCVLDHKKS